MSGTTPLVLDRVPAARAPHAALDLVGDEHDAVLGAEVGQPLEEAGRRDDEPAFALDRLDQHAGDVLLADVLVHLVERVRERLLRAALRAARPPVRVGHRQAVDLRRERPEALLVRHDLRGERHRHVACVRGTRGRSRRSPGGPWRSGRPSPRSRPPRRRSWRRSSSSGSRPASRAFRRSASSIVRFVPGHAEHVCVSRSSCRTAASTTSGAEWPTFRTAIPVAKSISRLPSTSSTIAPEACAATIALHRRERGRHGCRAPGDPLLGPRPRDLGEDLPLLWDVHGASSCGVSTAPGLSAYASSVVRSGYPRHAPAADPSAPPDCTNRPSGGRDGRRDRRRPVRPVQSRAWP